MEGIAYVERAEGGGSVSTINTGGPAFPIPPMTILPNGQEVPAYEGMSLRDWFAGQALAGLLADNTDVATYDGFAKSSYLMADAMITERSKQ